MGSGRRLQRLLGLAAVISGFVFVLGCLVVGVLWNCGSLEVQLPRFSSESNVFLPQFFTHGYYNSSPGDELTAYSQVEISNDANTSETVSFITERLKIESENLSANSSEDGEATRHGQDSSSRKKIELVKPVKTSPAPLNEHDILFSGDQLKTDDHQSLRHHSGHFRHKQATIWDPHPQYEFTAFGKKFQLELRHDSSFVLPNIQVTHVWNNRTEETPPTEGRPEGCLYSGKVKGDAASKVAVSLCNGMKGHIRTSTGNFFIEPAEQAENFTTPILHHFYRVPATDKEDSTASHCGLTEENIEVQEILSEPSTTQETPSRSRRKRSTSQEYFVELMVAADQKMADYHGAGLHLYILTLVSVVASIYKDVTIGNPISIALVKLVILRDSDFSEMTHREMSGPERLKKFCAWQRKLNEENGANSHYDAAVLLTRGILCQNTQQSKCHVLGLAEVGTVCAENSGCAVVQDNGLSAAFSIAHEIGHLLNIPHDDDPKCNTFRQPDSANNVMSRVLDHSSNPWVWSNCSRHYLTEFLDAERGSCFLNTPGYDYLDYRTLNLPGEKFSVNRQCELVYGNGSEICPYKPACKNLWCTKVQAGGEIGCQTEHQPWADGTPCADGLWCQRGECVPENRYSLQPIDGQWGGWQPYGPCSRSCGGGVKQSVRYCDEPPPANGGKYCIGARVRYKSCNVQECPPNTPDFREEQCAKFNNNNFNVHGLSTDVKWVPKYGTSKDNQDDRCKLYCRVASSKGYYSLGNKVIDGTKCTPDTYDMCVNGVCKKADCNHILDSDAQLDACGVCGGDNSSCIMISGTYNESIYGYSKVVRIPIGASSLDIRQDGYIAAHKNDNYLALSDGETGEYILNGNFSVRNKTKLILYGGTILEYSGSEAIVERVNSSKPLTKDLVVEVLSNGNLHSPNIVYQYWIQDHFLNKFKWKLTDKWSPCTKVCKGETERMVKCVKLDEGHEVAADYCAGLPLREPVRKSCNVDCELKWLIVSQSECSAMCGSGHRTLRVQCIQHFHHPFSSPVPLNNSTCNFLPKPPTDIPCNGPCNRGRWRYSQWGACSKTCGAGVQTRQSECVDENDEPLPETDCSPSDKYDKQACATQKCPQWSVGSWGECSASCGMGKRQRSIWCQINNLVVEPYNCPLKVKPSEVESCNKQSCPKWIEGPWSYCSVTCGEGIITRPVKCSSGNDDDCLQELKPDDTKICYEHPCQSVHENEIPDSNAIYKLNRWNWRYSDWEPCSTTCGEGIRRRSAICYDEIASKISDYSNCNSIEKPRQTESCFVTSCGIWNISEWGPCSVSCEQGTSTREVACISVSGGLPLPEQECNEPKPLTETVCEAAKQCSAESNIPAQWLAGAWSQCSKPCDGGFMSRQVICQVDGQPSTACDMSNKPETTAPCNQQPCIKTTWNFGDWSQCNVSCGGGFQHRQVRCQESMLGFAKPDSSCSHTVKPAQIQPCNLEPCPDDGKKYIWKPSIWGQCSTSCGPGVQYREVKCQRIHKRQTLLVSNEKCDLKNKPPSKQSCQVEVCNTNYFLVPGPWTACSHTCGKKGRQRRKLYCYDQRTRKKVRRSLCNTASEPTMNIFKPARKRKCNQKRCSLSSCLAVKEKLGVKEDREYPMTVAGRNISIFCHNMKSENPQEFLSLPSGENYAEIYGPRLMDPRSCPYGGERKDNCPCINDSNRGGLTVFHKVRLNVTTLTVIRNDFTFAKQLYGMPVYFGEAGDCYSKLRCPQGRFSIDLRGTGLRVSSQTQWTNIGTWSNKQIDHLEDNRSIVGRCGGYCGTCRPEHDLKLDTLPP
nr:PREDICTED: A disintegrin and metalloproteinase with thrombospondin motifs 9-like isoform X3 [Bemisia tabaci]